MGFVGEVLNGVKGIQYFYIVGLLIFMVLFFVMIYRTVKIPKKDLVNFKTSILDNQEFDSTENI
jgi:high-affinity Fe2+/Pb2+ permease